MRLSIHQRTRALHRWSKARNEDRRKFYTGKDAGIIRAALCGFLAGDGNVAKYKQGSNDAYRIACYPDDALMLEVYLSFIRVLYHKEPTVKLVKNHYQVSLYARSVYEDLTSYASFGLHTWRPPTELNKEEKSAWLRAFFSAEGYVNSKVIRVQTINQKGMDVLSRFLLDLGIAHRRYIYKPKNLRHSAVHIINIQDASARLRFCETVGFWHEKKCALLEKQHLLKSKSNFRQLGAAVA